MLLVSALLCTFDKSRHDFLRLVMAKNHPSSLLGFKEEKQGGGAKQRWNHTGIPLGISGGWSCVPAPTTSVRCRWFLYNPLHEHSHNI